MTNSAQDDQIGIHGLGLVARVGVPAIERATSQRLEADITLWPQRALSGLGDELAGTIDYAAVAARCRDTAAAREFRLIETLAEELCAVLLHGFPLNAVQIRLKKFILPDTAAVSVSLTRRCGDMAAAPPSPPTTP
jgi:dihydroneopterin aldolase